MAPLTTAAMLALLAPTAAYQLLPVVRGARHAAAPSSFGFLMQLEGEMKIVSEETYGLMLKTLLQTQNKLEEEISTHYALIDYAFLQRLEQATADPDEAVRARAEAIKAAVTQEMAKRMQTAAQTLREIFASPTPVIMDGKIAGLARSGKIDGALYDLLHANLEQAKAAGAEGANAVAMLTKLQERVRNELDAKLEPPVALIRRLMRMESSEARQRLLREKMAPKKTSKIVIAGVGGEQGPEDSTPDVPPRVLAETIKDLKLRFGNVDEKFDSGFVKKLNTIGDEAEAVALELAGGRELSAKEAQDMAWERQTVSVWALEQVEEEAHQDGNFAVWEKEAQEQMARQEAATRARSIQQDLGK
ncbi:hypothetical protein AB1Y20_023415 [Prymnesium parvum]|uniref:Uncharacterized protein n=1 Tax=Prymnesium parvum TaxID=97485 RepID=A0AB34JFE1_PRYPA|mmetsp:Transcript_42183/g.105058  ORF Transcript_42183/g.105058 Transcript_42183/m.105058 type:complete len:361 (+) Transcript_42183:53-1135(+)